MPEIDKPEFVIQAQDYLVANILRLPPLGRYRPSKYRNLDDYMHSREHRRLWAVVTAATMGTPWKDTGYTRADLDAAYRAELAQTLGSQFELWTHTSYAEAVYGLGNRVEWQGVAIDAIRASSIGNVPVDVLDEMLAEGIADPFTLAGL